MGYYLYEEASLKAKNTNKKLLVIGDPNSGFLIKIYISVMMWIFV